MAHIWRTLAVVVLLFLSLAPGCAGAKQQDGPVATRVGDEIVIAGEYVHTGAPVVLWTDPGGYEAYRTDGTNGEAGNFGERPGKPSDGWTRAALTGVVDQFVLHYDACGFSSRCFDVLHHERGLSVHFLLDVDGTIYQTLDLQERAWHATKANGRSVGVEIANVGAYPPNRTGVLGAWYGSDAGGVVLRVPEDAGVRTPGFVGRPARGGLFAGGLNGGDVVMRDYTFEQYRALARLTAALHTALPGIALDVPRDADGGVTQDVLRDEAYERFAGVLGHWHVQANKVDPGPAMDWDAVLAAARAIVETDDPDAGDAVLRRAFKDR